MTHMAGSVLMEQHARWAASRERLMGKVPTRQLLLAHVAPLPAPEPEEPAEPIERDWLIIEQSLPPDQPTRPPGPLVPHWKVILHEVAAKHKLKVVDILSTRRQRPVVAARHEAMFRMKTETSMSFPSIGRRMGGLDHTTVINGLRRHTVRMAMAASR